MSEARRANGRHGVSAGGAVYPRHNTLNTLRLIMAAAVLVDHARPVGGFGSDPMVGKVSLGALAVFSFFGLSGFLIAGSALRTGGPRYLANRVLRIVPGYWVCIAVTAFVLSPVASAFAPGGSSSFSLVDSGEYVVKNLFLVVVQPVIGGTLAHAPHTQDWNASLWTLPFEFGCYLAVLALAVLGVLGRPRIVYALTGMVGLATLPALLDPSAAARYGSLGMHGCELLLMFGCGACLRLQSSIRLDDLRLGAAALVIVAVSAAFFAHPVPLLGLSLCYALLCLGAQSARPALVRRNDISYGIYIYGMPVEQVLAQTALARHGLALYTVSAFVFTVPLAILSWTFVERPALALKRGRSRPAPQPDVGVAGRTALPASSIGS